MKASIAVSTIVALIAAGSAAAAPQPVGNFISLHLGPSPGVFRGAVHSDVLECIAYRKVRIVRVSGNDVRVAKTFTDDRGHYSVVTSEFSGDWIAKVKHETVPGEVECAGAQSKIRSAG